ncbi:MAG: hypothetical protein DRP51_01150 [Candidatus Zixiibacteriota bacterium]|nr:MAG: hypothetical protein DRP51_01150 [candidate division Zixibacteria bacterium]
MVERRKLKRRYTSEYVNVFDEATGDLAGHLDNITSEGMMIAGNKPVQPGKNFKFRIIFPFKVDDRKHIVIDATSIWCNQDENTGFCETGYKFQSVSFEIIDRIQKFAEESIFSDERK